ncbi:hypothetical protein PS723_06609 [Pseudomonas fluorescens]|uniref:Uncharacterized protein n=1 Tax=Pseudomonas fluorescens TaxID=294 RepID=A0A5E7G3J6_PSEFL|nr:hypothetical protein PS723_06609 [Pseudomonas fluorescens]
MFRAQDTAFVRQVAGRARIFHQGATKTQVLGCAYRGADTGVTHETADDQVQRAEVLQTFFQLRAMEGTGQQLADDGLVTLWLEARDELTACALRVEHSTHGAEVMHMHNRPAGSAGRGDQLLDVFDGSIHAGQGQWATEILFLGINDDQAGMAQTGRCITTAGELKHRLWNGHSGAPLGRAFATLSSG